VPLRLAGTTLAFQLLPAAAAALTARGLLELLEALYLTPCKVTLPPEALRVAAGRTLLEPRARVAGAGRLSLRVEPAAGTTGEALLELLRTRVERRFRPGEAT
jgi:hypothetical protein